MSIGIFLVGLVVSLMLFFFGSDVYYKCSRKVLAFVITFIGIIFFTIFWILALSFPNGFEEIKENIRGNAIVHLKFQVSNQQEMTNDDKAIVEELKRCGFVISSIKDDYNTDHTGKIIAYYRLMSLVGPKQDKFKNSLSSKYDALQKKW